MDIASLILENLNEEELMGNNKLFWKEKTVKKFGEKVSHFKLDKRTWRSYFLNLLVYCNDDAPNKYWDITLSKLAEQGMKNIDLIKFILSKAKTDDLGLMNSGMYGAAKGGDEKLIIYFITKGADWWDKGMEGAAEGGFKELVYFFISKGARNWNLGMKSAIYCGNKS